MITPVAYVTGTTLDASPNGTGPWKLTSYDQATGAEFARNDEYWGGAPSLETVTWSFFDDTGTMVTAGGGGEVDVILQFQAVGGEALYDNPDFNVVGDAGRNTPPDLDAMRHRSVRGQAGASSTRDGHRPPGLDRNAVQGQGRPRQRPRDRSRVPVLRPSVPQRTKDAEGAKQLLADAGFPDGISAVLHFGQLQEIPQLAQLIQAQVADVWLHARTGRREPRHVLRSAMVPAEPADPPCSGAAELGIVDYGHRATPDVYLNGR